MHMFRWKIGLLLEGNLWQAVNLAKLIGSYIYYWQHLKYVYVSDYNNIIQASCIGTHVNWQVL